MAKTPEGAQILSLVIFGDVGHLRAGPSAAVAQARHPKPSAMVPGNKTGCRSMVEVWLIDAAEVPERHRLSLAGSGGKRGIYRAPLCLAQSPKIAKMPEGAQHYLLATFGGPSSGHHLIP